MSVYKSAEEFTKIYEEFMRRVMSHPRMGPKLASSKLVITFVYTDPNVSFTVNFKPDAPKAKEGDHGAFVFGPESPWKVDVTFTQTADLGNKFWQGKVNVIAALAKRQVRANGSITSALKLLPAIRPAFKVYPEVLKDLGFNHLVIGGLPAESHEPPQMTAGA